MGSASRIKGNLMAYQITERTDYSLVHNLDVNGKEQELILVFFHNSCCPDANRIATIVCEYLNNRSDSELQVVKKE